MYIYNPPSLLFHRRFIFPTKYNKNSILLLTFNFLNSSQPFSIIIIFPNFKYFNVHPPPLTMNVFSWFSRDGSRLIAWFVRSATRPVLKSAWDESLPKTYNSPFFVTKQDVPELQAVPLIVCLSIRDILDGFLAFGGRRGLVDWSPSSPRLGVPAVVLPHFLLQTLIWRKLFKSGWFKSTTKLSWEIGKAKIPRL